MIAGIAVLLIIVFGSSVVDVIPMAALVGVMFVVAINLSMIYDSIRKLDRS